MRLQFFFPELILHKYSVEGKISIDLFKYIYIYIYIYKYFFFCFAKALCEMNSSHHNLNACATQRVNGTASAGLVDDDLHQTNEKRDGRRFSRFQKQSHRRRPSGPDADDVT